jgi:hypothetical protein
LPEEKPLPSCSDKWVYSDWQKEITANRTTYVTTRSPNIEYFVGNVFQIVIKDEEGDPIGTGSGFVINDEGWFITNHHVMEDAYSAEAYFDIIDVKEGARYTKLEILGSVYDSKSKDIYIGKISNYQKIKEKYKKITFTEDFIEVEDGIELQEWFQKNATLK